MSHPRIRKAAVAGEGPRARACPIKGAGDTVKHVNNTMRAKQGEVQRIRSKNRIPQSVRYDLENALVSLCDVWFEDIKPHLMRNNIKVHVHNGMASAASGDNGKLPPGAPGCSHFDPGAALDHYQLPGANYAGCCPKRPSASRVQSRRPPAMSTHPLQSQPPSSLPKQIRTILPNPIPNRDKKLRPRKRRKCPPVPAYPNWRVPRLCRTQSMSPIVTPHIQSPKRKIHTASLIYSPSPPPYTDHFQSATLRSKVKMKNKATQTECHSRSKTKSSLPTPMKNPTFTRIPYGSFPANTTLARPTRRNEKVLTKSRELRNADDRRLFDNDLISIISEKYDKKLRLLFKNPSRDEYLSVMNLIESPTDKKSPVHYKEAKPWR